jgi:hypothetical protein
VANRENPITIAPRYPSSAAARAIAIPHAVPRGPRASGNTRSSPSPSSQNVPGSPGSMPGDSRCSTARSSVIASAICSSGTTRARRSPHSDSAYA